jgi:hypothetical protein
VTILPIKLTDDDTVIPLSRIAVIDWKRQVSA